ncbi:MAG: gfo/Idh/MocA family oxidoreductase, partial [Chloroflexota bacterium]|nr:gfo/Idh/MocA family oxidoreductase [Chloroflexota bacterium]
YYPVALYCRQRFANGDFGRFVYGEGEYLHDMFVGFYEAYQYSGGEQWKRTASFPPMLYPSHSTSMILSVTGARMTEVACMGWVDDHPDGVFRADVSLWGNVFSNETALFRTSDGGMCRTNEFRRVGYHASPEVRMSLFGTEANYEEQTNARVWNTRNRAETQDLTEMLACRDREISVVEEHGSAEASTYLFRNLSDVHPVERLPREFAGLENGHEGSHQFLALDFIEACISESLPPNHVWQAARYCAPGIVAHESAQRGGELLKIPDWGGPGMRGA